ncbi:MAG: elongation factor G [Crocosphaera sp.]|nr:elongation factor G [Crocosphaera sp.]
MNLTLPKWLHSTFSITKPTQTTHGDSFKDKTFPPVSIQKKDLSANTLSLNYLDDYIHQYF